MEKNGIVSTAPPVVNQLPTVPFNRHGIDRYAYNGSLVEYRGRRLLSYRYHTGSLATKLSIAKIDDKWAVKYHKPILSGDGSHEDCSLWTHGDKLFASWVNSTWPKLPPQCVMKYGELTETDAGWKCETQITPAIGKNDWTAMEKNWIFFHNAGEVWAIYQQTPKQIVHRLTANTIAETHETPFPHWPWGLVKGGTPPVPFKGNLLSFAHSTLDNESAQWRRRYYMLAVVREPNPPFKVVAMSKTPMLRGSELGTLSDTERSGCSHFKGLVVFPLGCVATADGWLVSLGVNDSEVSIVKVDEGALRL